MKIEFNDMLRLIALIAAIVFFAIGIWMIVNGISAEGFIDIKSALVSGSLKTGSAGLFIVLIAFILAVFALVPSLSFGRSLGVPTIKEKSRLKKALHVFYILCGGLVLSVLGAIFIKGEVKALFILGSVAIGFIIFIWLFFISSIIEKE